MPRPRLTPEEYEIIRESREAALDAGRRLGGAVSGAQTKNALAAAKSEKEEKIKRIAKKVRTTVPPRIPEALSLGGKNRIKQIQELTETYKLAFEPDAKYGAVFGMEGTSLQEGTLREDIVCELRPGKIGVISDAHWPFHDLRRDSDGNFYGSYLTAIEKLRESGIDTLVLNGDMMDLFHLSKHEKLEAKRNWKWELDVSRAMLKHLREFFGDKVRIVYREGNHEERFKRYIADKAKELEDAVNLTEMLGLDALRIEWVSDRAKITAGGLYIDHGHEYFGGGGLVNPARNFFLKTFDNILVGHVHKKSEAIIRRPLDGSYMQAHSIGCLCDLNPRYAPRNQWTHGFALVELDKHGEFTLHNRIIMNGKVV